MTISQRELDQFVNLELQKQKGNQTNYIQIIERIARRKLKNEKKEYCAKAFVACTFNVLPSVAYVNAHFPGFAAIFYDIFEEMQRELNYKITLAKKCSKCKKELHFEHFHNDIKAQDGKQAYCKKCKKESSTK